MIKKVICYSVAVILLCAQAIGLVVANIGEGQVHWKLQCMRDSLNQQPDKWNGIIVAGRTPEHYLNALDLQCSIYHLGLAITTTASAIQFLLIIVMIIGRTIHRKKMTAQPGDPSNPLSPSAQGYDGR
jgi:hypothetical protein